MRIHSKIMRPRYPQQTSNGRWVQSYPRNPGQPTTLKLLGKETLVTLPSARDVAEQLTRLLRDVDGVSRIPGPTGIPRDSGIICMDIAGWEHLIRRKFSFFPPENYPFTIHLDRMVLDLAKALLPLIARSPVGKTYEVAVNRFQITHDGYGLQVLTELSEDLLQKALQKFGIFEIILGSGLSYMDARRSPYPTISIQPTFFRKSQVAFDGIPAPADFQRANANPDPVGKVVLSLFNAARTFSKKSLTVAF